MSKALVLIPTYNEKENVEDIIRAVFALKTPFHVLVIDDNSPDGTASIVHGLMDTFEDNLFILERAEKNGLGAAYIAGFKYALERGYDYVFEMDADFSHNPLDLERLYQTCQLDSVDMAVGSRYVKGGKLENWPFDRIFLSKGASYYVQLLTWMGVKDATAGFVCYTNKVLANLDFSKIHFVGYAFQIEMKYSIKTLGYKIKEIPITFKDREKGQSKMSPKIIKEAILGVLYMRFWSFFNSYKKQ